MSFEATKSLVLFLMLTIVVCIGVAIYGHFIESEELSTLPQLVGLGCLWGVHKCWPSELEGWPWRWEKSEDKF